MCPSFSPSPFSCVQESCLVLTCPSFSPSPFSCVQESCLVLTCPSFSPSPFSCVQESCLILMCPSCKQIPFSCCRWAVEVSYVASSQFHVSSLQTILTFTYSCYKSFSCSCVSLSLCCRSPNPTNHFSRVLNTVGHRSRFRGHKLFICGPTSPPSLSAIPFRTSAVECVLRDSGPNKRNP